MVNATAPVLALDPRFGPLAQLSERLTSLDLSRVLVNLIDLAEPAVLPFLAEQFHITGFEGWNFAADDEARRALIKSAIELHRYKGTPWAVKQALTTVGLEHFTLIEHPADAHWAEFDLEISVIDRPLTEAVDQQITQMIEMYKPQRSHLRRLQVSVGSVEMIHAACLLFSGDIVTVQPYKNTEFPTATAMRCIGIGMHVSEVLTIYPRMS
ncbi:phage tail protein [Iodobacter sp. BJB302]|uniref:phage tail protein n=1 Tax=Iodobacter sp. BJB302 TaxID=1506510 RepID=UPI000C0F28DA|nr:phage tail protein [Iodobacter sp. BJB302]PHV00155.1 phage tail protein [Iodobacter sp. BJB302]